MQANDGDFRMVHPCHIHDPKADAEFGPCSQLVGWLDESRVYSAEKSLIWKGQFFRSPFTPCSRAHDDMPE